jgi:ABC-type spermidine/putrescine transport system permease subunit I
MNVTDTIAAAVSLVIALFVHFTCLVHGWPLASLIVGQQPGWLPAAPASDR